MSPYYQAQLAKGQEFQDCVMRTMMRERALPLLLYSSKRWQFQEGEGMQGIEIKRDGKWRESGNLYIELAEGKDGDFVPSGINCKNWLFLIGDESTLFVFSTRQLRVWDQMGTFATVKTETSRGMLVPVADARAWAAVDVVETTPE